MQQNLSYEFSYGSGLVNPLKALSPGLVYEMSVADCSKLLCTLGVNMTRVVGHNVTCVDSPKLNARDMNYPWIVLSVNTSITPLSFNVSRTVTNVGPGNSTYKATLSVHPRVNITVAPDVLRFNSTYQKATFSISVTLTAAIRPQEVLSSSLVWSDGLMT
ncbi:hypothetical protein MLD38_031413 [Melastoma candidum]|uniref:Uncharacterized protein n=1 Tax=Melastoma candidum TaxID=119954 RepID=A0ACB9MPL8_9MYRT|nr:hypothetical protein MLD38_031413 [Melastoma candidum]